MTLLYTSSRGDQRLLARLWQHCEDLTGDVALQAAQDLLFGLALGGAPCHVVAGGRVPAQPDDHDSVQRRVGLPVTTPVQPMPSSLAGGGLHRRGAAERGER